MGRRVDVDELVDATTVAEILGLSARNAVSVYRKRHADFPDPVVERSRCVLWLRRDIEDWRRRRTTSR